LEPFFILVGYAFSIMIIQQVVSALLIVTLPELHFKNLSTWPPSTQDEIAIANTGIQENWGKNQRLRHLPISIFPM